jgi:hypothetical protein
MQTTSKSEPSLANQLECDSNGSRLAYEAPKISLLSLSAVIAGAGGSQADDDFSVSKPGAAQARRR